MIEERLQSFAELSKELEQRYLDDARRFAESNPDECMLCGATSGCTRPLDTLTIRYLHDLKKQVPEMVMTLPLYGIDAGGFLLRTCKTCQGVFLWKMWEWRSECIAKRGKPMDDDGRLLSEINDTERNIPVRVDGVVKWFTRAEWDARNKGE